LGNRDGYLKENFIFDTSGMKKTEKLWGDWGSIWIEELGMPVSVN